MALTEKRIPKLKPGRHRDTGTVGLYLQVRPSGARSWLLRFELAGRERYHGLGGFPLFGLKEARARANAARQLLADNVDPIERKRSARAAQALEAAKAVTFAAAAQMYFDAHERGWTRKHAAQFLSSMRAYVFPKIGAVPVAAVDTGLVLKCIEPIWHTTTATANRVRNRTEMVLDFATVRGYRTGDNPARWKGHLANVLPARNAIQPAVNHSALPYAEIPAFMAGLRRHESVSARALEFLVLTATRTGAVLGATWTEIDLAARMWVVPGDRAGAKITGTQSRRVPLSARAIEILRALPREADNPYVFIGDKGKLGKTSLQDLLGRLRPGVTVHGFRSTFKDWASEMTSVANVVSEMALWHAVGDKVERAYRRTDLFDKRAKLMAAWARYCSSTPGKAGGDNVVTLRAGQ